MTITTSIISYYTGVSYTSSSSPSSTAVEDMITRAGKYIDEIAPDCSSDLKDLAIIEIVLGMISNYYMMKYNRGAESSSGESTNFRFNIGRYLSSETRKLIILSSAEEETGNALVVESFRKAT